MGSNSVGLVCYSADHTGAYVPYHYESSSVRPDEHGDGSISEASLKKMADALHVFRNEIRYQGVGDVTAVATSAVRRARNREYAVRRLRRETGFDLAVLSGRDEALYSYLGAATRMDAPDAVFFDIGGGSVEIVAARNHDVLHASSVPLGALVMARKFAGGRGLDGDSAESLREHVRRTLPAPEELGGVGGGAALIGVGGAVRALAAHAQRRTSYPIRKLHNYEMDSGLVRRTTAEILDRDASASGEKRRIGRGRADVVKAGAVVVECIMERYGMDGVRASATGLRAGVLAASLGRAAGRGELTLRHVRELARDPRWKPRAPPAAAAVARALASPGPLSAGEASALRAAAANLGWLRTFRDTDDFVYRVLDSPAPLSHREQLLSALCLAHVKEPGRVRPLMKRYAPLLRPGDGHSIARLSAVLSFCAAAAAAGADVRARLSAAGLRLEARERRGVLPDAVMERKRADMEAALGVSVECKIKHAPSPKQFRPPAWP